MTTQIPCERILLATDLSGRCDRATDRAIQLARDWAATLHVLHSAAPRSLRSVSRRNLTAPSWRQEPSPVEYLEKRIREDFEADGAGRLKVHVRAEAPAAAVLELIDREAVDLLITGLASDRRYDGVRAGRLNESLWSELKVPHLIVRRKVRGPLRRIVVASDLSAESAPSLATPARWFPDAELTLFHAFDAVRSASAGHTAAVEAARREAEAKLSRFAETAGVGGEGLSRIRKVIENGYPEDLVCDFVEHEPVDLLVLQDKGRGEFARAFLGDTAQNLLNAVDCDVLLVPRAQ